MYVEKKDLALHMEGVQSAKAPSQSLNGNS